jgi:hypothetical protein
LTVSSSAFSNADTASDRIPKPGVACSSHAGDATPAVAALTASVHRGLSARRHPGRPRPGADA